MNRYAIFMEEESEEEEEEEEKEERKRQKSRMRHRIAGVIVRDAAGRYAVVKGRDTGRWSFPKGHAKRGETMNETAYREMCEEIGPRPLPPYRSQVRLGSVWYYMYSLDPIETYQQPPLICSDVKEIEDVRWMTLPELAREEVNCGIAEWIRRHRPF